MICLLTNYFWVFDKFIDSDVYILFLNDSELRSRSVPVGQTPNSKLRIPNSELQTDDRTRDIPVIFISALGDVFDKVKALQAGGVNYIT